MELALEGGCPGGGLEYAGSVSILVFVELALEEALKASNNIARIMFQSLFLWNSPSKAMDGAVELAANQGFQSLFLWNSPSKLHLQLLGRPCLCVSILVFVELALEARQKQ